MILDRDLTGKRLFEEIERMMKNPELVLRMGENMKALAKPHAAQEILNICRDMSSKC